MDFKVLKKIEFELNFKITIKFFSTKTHQIGELEIILKQLTWNILYSKMQSLSRLNSCPPNVSLQRIILTQLRPCT